MSEPIDLPTCTEAELWRYVASHLERQGIGVVLVGGAVVAVYTDGAYRSGDLDFVSSVVSDDRLSVAMAEIGFHRTARHYVHADCPHLYVEFLGGHSKPASDGRFKTGQLRG